MTRHALTAASAALITLAALVACQSGPDTPAGPEHSRQSTPADDASTQQPTPTGSAEPGPTVLELDSARPLRDVVTVRQRFPVFRGQRSTGVVTVSDDGDVLVKRLPAGTTGSIAGERLELWRGGRPDAVTAVPKLDSPRPRQTIGADVSRRYVVWQESPGIELNVKPWVLFAFDRVTGQTTELARAAKVGRQLPPAVPGYTGPTLAGGWVYWAQVGGKVGAEEVDVYGCQVRRCRPKVLVKSAALPAATSDGVYAVTTPRYRGITSTTRTTKGEGRIVRIDADTGKQHIVRRIDLTQGHPSGLAAAEGHLAWTQAAPGRPDTLHVLDTTSGEAWQLASEPEGRLGYPVVTDTFAAVAESSGTSAAGVGGYLLHYQTGTLYSVGNTAGLYGIAGAGNVLFWQNSRTPAARPEDVVNLIGVVD